VEANDPQRVRGSRSDSVELEDSRKFSGFSPVGGNNVSTYITAAWWNYKELDPAVVTPPSGNLLLEDGTDLLLEDGTNLLIE
jgi:hypothetical protein